MHTSRIAITSVAVLLSVSMTCSRVAFAAGSALVANDGNKVKEIKSDGTSSQVFAIPDAAFAGDAGVSGAGGLAFDESFNYLYVTVSSLSSTNANAGVMKFGDVLNSRSLITVRERGALAVNGARRASAATGTQLLPFRPKPARAWRVP